MPSKDVSSAESTPPRRASTIAFEESCVLIDAYPLSMTDLEDGVKQRMSVAGASEKTWPKKSPSPRLSLTIPPALRKALPSLKLRVLPYRWSSSTPPYSTLMPTRSTHALPQPAQLSSPSAENPIPIRARSQPTSPATGNPPVRSRNPSVAEGLHMLSEREENTGHVSPNPLSGETLSPVSPTMPCAQSVWLCSPPRRHPTPPSSAPPSSFVAPSKPPTTASTRKNRPIVVRAMSTGRLAREFDQDGRVVCMSNHSNRVLQNTAVVITEGQENQHAQTTPKLRRAQTEKPAARKNLPVPLLSASTDRLPRRSSTAGFDLAALQKEAGNLARPNVLAKRVSSGFRRMSSSPQRIMA
ncbi:hypothetical protein L198_02817 [Cryptococcus wingfieldii CBS 7118]|uniref:Uncharacterized protein n=1 Tax=Cryptococcus wingfieldii CBS 7118 TaxID=1295528 RepID=A0A1E3JN57_9TREE|nr:hypothetical protein L198_02817 [Cryptococcus wingfieldii CBS 7118]ODO02086.1 hypothetical protein L198_02817 [Cryptococcus wingfieldii CBS 7118]